MLIIAATAGLLQQLLYILFRIILYYVLIIICEQLRDLKSNLIIVLKTHASPC